MSLVSYEIGRRPLRTLAWYVQIEQGLILHIAFAVGVFIYIVTLDTVGGTDIYTVIAIWHGWMYKMSRVEKTLENGPCEYGRNTRRILRGNLYEKRIIAVAIVRRLERVCRDAIYFVFFFYFNFLCLLTVGSPFVAVQYHLIFTRR